METRIKIDRSRDDLLTEAGKTTLRDRYALEGESYQDVFARVAAAYAMDDDHAQRLYDAMSKLWFMPASPILMNGGTPKGLPISCFLSEYTDSIDGLADTWNENIYLASNGGGIGNHIGNVRSLGEKAGKGASSGIIPFIKVQDSLTLAIAQGNQRRGSSAVYCDVWHPEVEEFVSIRRPTGDLNRRSLNIHHGLVIDDKFMQCVKSGKPYGLRSPVTRKVIKTIDARELWAKVLETRLETGEPYLLFIDNVNRQRSRTYLHTGSSITTSNLCCEIMLQTGKDYRGEDRTAVCCLSSINLATHSQRSYKEDAQLCEDIMLMLYNVLMDFILKAPNTMENAIYSANMERSIGIGFMGYHTYLQEFDTPFGADVQPAIRNIVEGYTDKIKSLNCPDKLRLSPCPDSKGMDKPVVFAHVNAVAPTATISTICGGVSPGLDPISANAYTHKTLSGTFTIKNPSLEKKLGEIFPDPDTQAFIWDKIIKAEGSVQDLDCLSDEIKEVYKTAHEIDQQHVVDLAIERTPHIDQGQSTNLFLKSDIEKSELHHLHYSFWERGGKGLYYCRATSLDEGDI